LIAASLENIAHLISSGAICLKLNRHKCHGASYNRAFIDAVQAFTLLMIVHCAKCGKLPSFVSFHGRREIKDCMSFE